MATINPGIQIKPPLSGQRSDLDQLDIPAGSAYLLRNWLRQDGKFIVRPGFANLGTALADIATGIIRYDHQSGASKLVIGTATKWFAYNDTTKDWSNITGTPLTGSAFTHQMFRVIYKSNVAYLIGVNGHSDTPKKWNGTDATYSDMGGSPPKAKCLAINNNRALLGNTYTAQPNIHQVDVGGFNDFEVGWGATQTVNLMDTPGEIVEMRELGNLLTAVYKTDSIYLAAAQAELEPFTFELKIAEIRGPASPRCVVSGPGGNHFFMAWDGSFWTFNGVSLSTPGPHLQAHIQQTADLGMISRSFGFFDVKRQAVWFIYRGAGAAAPNLGMIIDLADMSAWPVSFTTMRPTAGYGARLVESPVIGDLYMKIGELTQPISAWSHPYDHNLLVDSTGGQVAKDGALSDLGVAIPMEMETGLVLPADTRQDTTITESEHFFTRTTEDQNISMQIGYSKSGEDPAYTTARTINTKDKKHVLGHRKTGRMFSLKMSASVNQAVQWRGSVINGVPRGLK